MDILAHASDIVIGARSADRSFEELVLRQLEAGYQAGLIQVSDGRQTELSGGGSAND